MKNIIAKIWVSSHCKFAMPPAEVIQQSDPNARAWMFLGGDLHEGVGQSHVDIARNGLKSGSFGPHHIKDLTGDPPMGRATSDGTKMGLWFGSDKAFSPPFSTSITKAISAGMLGQDGVLVFMDKREMGVRDYLNALKQADMDQAAAGVQVNSPMTQAPTQALPAR